MYADYIRIHFVTWHTHYFETSTVLLNKFMQIRCEHVVTCWARPDYYHSYTRRNLKINNNVTQNRTVNQKVWNSPVQQKVESSLWTIERNFSRRRVFTADVFGVTDCVLNIDAATYQQQTLYAWLLPVYVCNGQKTSVCDSLPSVV